MKTFKAFNFAASLAALLAVALVPVGCSRAPQSGVLATVGDRQITTEDFKREIERRHAARRPVPDKETLLQEMVTFESLLQRAMAASIGNDPQTKHEINGLLVAKLQDRELQPQLSAVVVTTEEIKAEYEREIARYTQPGKVRLAVLVLNAGPKASESAREELRGRLMAAREKVAGDPQASDFGVLAIEYSDDAASRYRGGDIGWLDEGNFSARWPRVVLEAGYPLKHKEISPLIETKEGCFLVMKTDSRPGRVIPLADVDGSIRQSLTLKKRRQVEADFRAQAQRNSHAVINAGALAQVEVQLSLAQTGKSEAEPPVLSMMNGTKRP